MKHFSHNNSRYYHELDLSDDSINLKTMDGDVLVTYRSYCIAETEDGVLGKFSLQKVNNVDHWVFRFEGANEFVVGRPSSEPEGLIDTEVEISKLFLDMLEQKASLDVRL